MHLKRDMGDDEEVYETGFDEDFVEPLSDAHECPICLSALNNPMQTTCGHRFCKGCILKVLREGRACCPIDNTPIGNDDLHSDAFAKREISQLQVRCRFKKEFKCSWVGTLGKLEDHLERCEFALEDCPKQCGERLTKKKLDYHLKNECSKRIVACQYCGVKLIAARAQDHYETCMKVIVPCPNGCDQADITRENLQYHYEQECTKTKRKCLFRENGCMFEGTNKDIEKHMAESLQVHMLLLARENRSLKRDFSDLKCDLKNEDRRVGAEMSHFLTEELVQVRRQFEDIHLRTSKSHDLIDAYRRETTNENKELERCEFALEDSPKQCGERLSKKKLDYHLKNECSKRIVACQYCGVKLIAARAQDHYETCIKVIVPCPNGCDQADTTRENLLYHYENECTETYIPDQHFMSRLQYYEQERTNSNCECLFRENGCMFEVQVRRQLEDLDLRTYSLLDRIDAYRGETILIEDLRHLINSNTNMITDLNSKICNGHFVWRIPNFEALFQDAKSGKTPALHSIPFYSSIPGYRMCLRLNLNGIASGLNTHISMFLHFMQGDYDSIVTWPFNGSLKFKVMQQDPSNGQLKHIEKSPIPRQNLQAFLQPQTARNQKGYGYTEMVSHEILFSQGYVKENALIVGVEVTAGNTTQRSEAVEDAEQTVYEMRSPHIGNWQAESEISGSETL